MDALPSTRLLVKGFQSGPVTSFSLHTEQVLFMAVPGHDERDFDFAKMYDLPIKRVLVEKETAMLMKNLNQHIREDG